MTTQITHTDRDGNTVLVNAKVKQIKTRHVRGGCGRHKALHRGAYTN